jgi:anti-sigma factor RsiW
VKCPGPSCKEVCEFLSDFVDGQMSDARRLAFDAHLKACPPCAAYMEQFAATIKLSKKCCCPGKPELPVPDDLISAVCRAMQADGGCGAPSPSTNACSTKKSSATSQQS